MKRIKILILTLLGVIAVVCACLAAGCKFSLSLEEVKEKYGLTAQVTYFLNLHKGSDGKYNGGEFNNGLLIKNIYYSEGEIPLNLGEVLVTSGSTKLLVQDGYNFTGWHEVATDGDGNLLYADETVYSEADEFDGTKALKAEEEEYDFSRPLEKDEHVYLCGGFSEDVKLRFKFFCAEDDFEVKIKDDKGVVIGKYTAKTDVIDGVSYSIQADGGLSDVTRGVNIPGYTVIDLYENPDDAEPFSGWPIPYPEADEETGERPDVILYAKLLEGSWQIVRTPSDVKTMFSRALKTNYYVLNDIDCGELQVSTRSNFTGQIYGGKDSHVISNFVAKNSSALRNGTSGSLFGNIGADAKFRNITFEDFSVELEVYNGHDPDINFFAKSIADGAEFENFKISGELKITDAANSLLIDEDDWIFGSDKVYEGITVEKAVCFINGEEEFKVEKTTNTETTNTEDQS